MKLTIYHNPRCSKSRETLELLQARGLNPDIVRYLESPPNAQTLTDLLSALNLTAEEIMRRNEAEYRDHHDHIEAMSETQKIEWLAQNPRVLQRPIVVGPRGARIGRPPESVLEVLD